jgi:predicted transcriptional regulator
MIVTDTRDYELSVVFTDKEFKLIEALAHKDGKTIAEFVEWVFQTGIKIHELSIIKKE